MLHCTGDDGQQPETAVHSYTSQFPDAHVILFKNACTCAQHNTSKRDSTNTFATANVQLLNYPYHKQILYRHEKLKCKPSLVSNGISGRCVHAAGQDHVQVAASQFSFL